MNLDTQTKIIFFQTILEQETCLEKHEQPSFHERDFQRFRTFWLEKKRKTRNNNNKYE